MLTAIGNLLGRKPSKTAQPVSVPTAQFRSGSPMRRPGGDVRDTYARVFRFRPIEGSETPASVEIVGSFTRWQTVSLVHDPVQNTWSATVDGIQGKRTHHYALLVNGKPVHDPNCDGLAMPVGFDEEQFALQTEKGPRVLMLFSQAK
jgi:hypothetical protein